MIFLYFLLKYPQKYFAILFFVTSLDPTILTRLLKCTLSARLWCWTLWRPWRRRQRRAGWRRRPSPRRPGTLGRTRVSKRNFVSLGWISMRIFFSHKIFKAWFFSETVFSWNFAKQCSQQISYIYNMLRKKQENFNRQFWIINYLELVIYFSGYILKIIAVHLPI